MFPAKVCRHICRNKAQLSGVTKTDLTVYFLILLFLLVLFGFLFPPNLYVLLNNQCSNIYVRRATQRPTLYIQTFTSDLHPTRTQDRKQIFTYLRASIVAPSLTLVGNFARISKGQESARINACYYVCKRLAVQESRLPPASAKLQLSFHTAKYLTFTAANTAFP